MNALKLLKNRYQLLKLISQGRCLTYLAADEGQSPPVPCVVQQLDNFAFEQKAPSLKKISQHPQLPTLLDYFPENDRYYLVQEFIAGTSLAQVVEEEGIFNETQIWQLLTNLLPVLKFISDRQMIHGNIKPQNIIRPLPLDPINFVLVDFANVQIGSEINKGTIGSPEYAAPEQVKGQAVFASDLYSLGVTCIYLLTQISPFDLFDIANDCWVWQQYLTTKISDRLSKILDKLLQKSLLQRFQLADEVMLAMGIEAKTANYPSPACPWKCLHTLTGNSSNTLAISPDGNTMASSGDDIIKLWDLKQATLVNSVKGHSQAVTSVAFSPKQELLATASDDKSIKLWHLPTLEEIFTLEGHSHAVKSVSFSPDGEILASGGWDKQVKLWDVSTGEEIVSLKAHQLQVSAVAFSPQGQILASASFDRTIRLWQITQMQNRPRCTLMGTLGGHTRAVLAIAFSADGKILATGSDDNTIKLWDVNTRQLIGTVLGHSWSVVAVAFTADNETLISASWDKTIKLWKVSTTEEIATLTSHLDSVCAVAVNPVAQLIASGSRDKTIKLWKLTI
jgi:WD40 repeat protein